MNAGDVRIGGHPGVEVYRTAAGTIRKVASGAERAGLAREALALRIMGGRRAPRLLAVDINDADAPAWIEETDAGIHRNPTPEQWPEFRRQLIEILAISRTAGLRHGDLTGINLVWDGAQLWACDWQDSHPIGQPSPVDKHKLSDAMLAMAALAVLGDENRYAPRWTAVLRGLNAAETMGLPLAGRTLLDLGCHQGVFTELAAIEGMIATGVDNDPAALVLAEQARLRFRSLPGSLRYIEGDAGAIAERTRAEADVILMFSMFPYVLQRWPAEEQRAQGIEVLRRVLASCSVLFFETQIAGDGPGPAFLARQEDVGEMLAEAGGLEITSLVQVPVVGRDAVRAVWRAYGAGDWRP